MLEGLTEGGARSETGRKGPFHQRDDGSAVLLRLTRPVRGFCRVKGIAGRQDSGANSRELRGRHMIPDNKKKWEVGYEGLHGA